MTPYPLLFEPIFKPTVWGGRELERFGKRLPAGQAIGESWEIADVPGLGRAGQSVISNGWMRGMTLHQAIAAHRAVILGHARPAETQPDQGDGFPLLVKMLDARRSLSVQVHPSHAYAAAHPGARPKSEAWVVLQARPQAVVYRGLRQGLTPALLGEHLRSGAILEDLISRTVHQGDCIYLPTGTVHALGAGIVVAEVQIPGDTTFRLFDWGRGDRPLHVEEALACIDFEQPAPAQPAPRPRMPWRVGALTTTELLAVDEFTIERLDAADWVEAPIVTSGLPIVWMVIGGCARIRASGGLTVDLPLGTTVLLPAALEDALAALEPGASILKATPPSPTRGMIA